MTIFPRSPVWNVIQESAKKTKFRRSYFRKYSTKGSEIWTQDLARCLLKWVCFSTSETSQKKSYSENSTMTCLEQRNPRIQNSYTKCYETSSRKDRKDRSTPYNSASSRGKPPLHYINEQFLDDSNEKTSFLYIGV